MRSAFVLAFVMALPHLALAGATGSAQSPRVTGVFSVAPIGEQTCIAGVIPLPEGSGLLGVRWYNNDEDVVFQDVVVLDRLDDFGSGGGYHFGTVAGGVSEGWRELALPTAMSSEDGQLFAVFVLPAGSSFARAGKGGGPGFGYSASSGEFLTRFSADGSAWVPVERCIAIEGVASAGAKAAVGNPEAPSGPAAVNLVTGITRTYPNPGNPEIGIDYALDRDMDVRIDIYSLRGQRIRGLVEGRQGRGNHSVMWNGMTSRGTAAGSGVYLLRFEAGGHVSVSKVIINR